MSENTNLETIKKHAKRMGFRWPETRPGLELIVGEAATIARDLESALSRIAAANPPPVVVDPDPPSGPSDPPVVVDPPTVPPIIVDPPQPVLGAPDFSEFAFASRMPLWTPYAKPLATQLDWLLDGATRTARSLRGLGEHVWAKGGVGACYKRSLDAGHGPRVRFGVYGDAGQANLGGLYDSSGGWAEGDVCKRGQNGQWLPIDVEFVGLSDDAEIGVTWGGDFGLTERLAAFGIGLCGGYYDDHGQPVVNTHGIVANNPCGEIILDDFWMLYPKGAADGTWNAAIHAANWRRMVRRGLKRRGRRPSEPGVTFQRHAFYDKGSDEQGSETWTIGCDLRGGNHTGMQRRPGTDEPYLGRPVDTVVVADNVCNSAGWDHANEDGGAAFTFNATGGPTFIVRNEALNSRYMSLLVSAQPRYTGPSPMGNVVNHDRNWYDEDGYALADFYIDGNKFGNVGSLRHCVSISHARRVYFGDKNRVDGRLVFGQAGYHDAARASERVMLVGEAMRFPTPYTANMETGIDERMGAVAAAALNVPTWEEALR